MTDIATRVSYGRALVDLAEKYDFVVMDADLSGSTRTGKFAEKYPGRFINCGIAEGNMMSVAAGIAATGLSVFASSFAMFAAGRAFEQVRNSVGYPRLNVKICATHAGVTVGEDGGSHQCLEDIALMRAIPGMTVISPADDTEAYAAIEGILQHDGPVYCRLGRHPVPVVFHPKTYQFQLGQAVPVKEGGDLTVFATGVMLAMALQAQAILQKEGIHIAVVNVHTIKPLDEETVIRYAEKTRRVITAEEHSVIGGLGSAICETLSENCPVQLARVGVHDVFGVSGKAGELLGHFGLTGEGIAIQARRLLGLTP